MNVRGNLLQIFAIHQFTPDISWYKNSLVPTGIDDREREPEILGLLARVRAETSPAIVMGDFNMSDQTRSYSRMTSQLQDSFVEAGWGFGFTFPSSLRVGKIILPGPWIRLDYIFHSAGLSAQTAQVKCEGSSDHCYVVGRLSLVNP